MAGNTEPKAQASDKGCEERRKWRGREPWIYRPDMWRNRRPAQCGGKAYDSGAFVVGKEQA